MGIDRYFAEFLGGAAAPQQPDYSAHWSGNTVPIYGSQGLRGRVHRWAKAHNDFFLRYSPGPLYDLALSMPARDLPKRGFRRRQFTPHRSLRP
jgi:hypothetical protein